ncbi:MAG TPA: hypothetical protein VHY08_22600 [Bacillota bacterium]|nr:hypothetical protein [Bacillota bacterium]
MSTRLEDFLDRFGGLIFFGLVLIIGTLAKLVMFPVGNIDLDYCFVPWYDYIVEHGRFFALKDSFANYNAPYLYLLTLATYLPVAKYTAIKLIVLLFDFVAALAAYKIIGLKYRSQVIKMVAFLAVFLAPTVLVNSAYWGQCDIIYTSFLLWSVYFAFKRKGMLAMIAFGLAFSFKMQALFLLPLVGIFLIHKRIKFWHLIYIPMIFIILLLPNLFLGRSLASLLSIYWEQWVIAQGEGVLTANCATIYQLFDPGVYLEIAAAAKLIALIACLTIVFFAFKIRKSLDEKLILKLATFNALFVVFLLPNMHERYFFMADILSIPMAFYIPRLFYMPIVIGFSSLFSYLPFLRREPLVDLKILAVANAVMIILLAWELGKDVAKHWAGLDNTETLKA